MTEAEAIEYLDVARIEQAYLDTEGGTDTSAIVYTILIDFTNLKPNQYSQLERMKRSSAILMFATDRARNIELLRETPPEWTPLGTVRFEAHTGKL